MESSSSATGPRTTGERRRHGGRAIALLRTIAINGLIVLAAIAVYYFAILTRQRQFANDRAFRALGEVAQQIENKMGVIEAFSKTSKLLDREYFLNLGSSERIKTKDLNDIRQALSLTAISNLEPRWINGAEDAQNPCMEAAFKDSCTFELKPFIQLTGSGTLLKLTLRLFAKADVNQFAKDDPFLIFPKGIDIPGDSLIDSSERLSEFDELLLVTPEGELLSSIMRPDDQSVETARVHREILDDGGMVRVRDLLAAAHRQLWSQDATAIPGYPGKGQGESRTAQLPPDMDLPPGFNGELAIRMSGRDYKAFVRPYRPSLPLYRVQGVESPTRPVGELYLVGLKKQELFESGAADLGSGTNWYLMLILAGVLCLAPIVRLQFQERGDSIGRLQARLIRFSMVMIPSLLTLALLSVAASRALTSWADVGAERYANAINARLKGDMQFLLTAVSTFDDWYKAPQLPPLVVFPFRDSIGSELVVPSDADATQSRVSGDACSYQGIARDFVCSINRQNQLEKSKPFISEVDLPPITYTRLKVLDGREHAKLLGNWAPFTSVIRTDVMGYDFGPNLTPFKVKVDVADHIDLGQREYFTALRNRKGWPLSKLLSSTNDGRYVAERLFNKIDGAKRLQVAIPRMDGDPLNGRFLGVASLDSDVYALSAAVQPLFYRFAVVDEDSGTVVFHTDDRRSLVENFKVEAAKTPGLLGAMRARTEGSFAGTYYGVSSRFYYLPLNFAPWGIVVMYPDDVLGTMVLFAGLTTLFTYMALVLATLIVGSLMIFPRRARMSWLWPQWSKRNHYPRFCIWISLHILIQVLILAAIDGLALALALGIDAIGMIAGAYLLLGKPYPFLEWLRRWRILLARVPLLVLMILPFLWPAPIAPHWPVVLLLLIACAAALAVTKSWQALSGREISDDDALSPFMEKMANVLDLGHVDACKLAYLASMAMLILYLSIIPTGALFLMSMSDQEDAAMRAGLLEGANTFKTRVAKVGFDTWRQMAAPDLINHFPSALAISKEVEAPGFTFADAPNGMAVLRLNLMEGLGKENPSAPIRDRLVHSTWGLIAPLSADQTFRQRLGEPPVAPGFDAARYVERNGTSLVARLNLFGTESVSVAMNFPRSADAYLLESAFVGGTVNKIYTFALFGFEVLVFMVGTIGLLVFVARRLLGLDLLARGNRENLLSLRSPKDQGLVDPPERCLLIGAINPGQIKSLPGRSQSEGVPLRIDLATATLETLQRPDPYWKGPWLLLRLDTAVLDQGRRPLVRLLLDRLLNEHEASIWVTAVVDPLQRLANPEEYPESERIFIDESELAGWSEILLRFRKEFVQADQVAPVVPEPKDELEQYIHNECRIFSQSLGEQMRKRLEELRGERRIRTEQDIQFFVVSHARPWFQRAWLTCSTDERLALFQLARGQFLNPLNDGVIEHLLRKKLIFMNPDPTPASHAWKRFILDAETPKMFELWTQQAQQGIWQSLRIPLFVALLLLVAFVAYSAGDAFKAISAVVAGTLTFLGQAFQALRIVKGTGVQGGG